MTTCANGVRCAAYDRVHHIAGRASRCPLCEECILVSGREIYALKLDYRDLAQWLPPGAGGMTQRVAGTSEPAVPLRLAVDALQRDIAWTLTAWEPVVREISNLAPERVRGVRQGWAVSTAVDVIAPRVRVLSRVGPMWGGFDGLDAGLVERDGVYAVASLRRLHRRAVTALGLTRHVVRLPGVCSYCGAGALEREPTDLVRCGNCQRRWTPEEYRRYVAMELVTAAEDSAPGPP